MFKSISKLGYKANTAVCGGLSRFFGYAEKHKMLFALVAGFMMAHDAFAQNPATYDTGATAFKSVGDGLAKWGPAIQKVIYAIAGIVALVGAISVYIKMNNEEQDVKKSIMMIVGAVVFLIAAATALPLMLGQTWK